MIGILKVKHSESYEPDGKLFSEDAEKKTVSSPSPRLSRELFWSMD